MQNKSESIEHKEGGLVLGGLTDQDWKDLIDRLKLFVNSYYFNVDAEDLIMEAIEAVLSGRRHWNQTKPAFHNFCSIIRSVASNRFEKEKRFTPLVLDTETPTTHDARLVLPSAPSHAETYEQRENDENFRAQLERSLQGDTLSLRLADYLIDNPTAKPEMVAEDLGEGKRKIYNARKRLLRKLKAWMEVPKRLYEK